MSASGVRRAKRPARTQTGGWDLQKIDLGIAMCHFACGMGNRVRLVIADPGLSAPESTVYTATLIVEG